MCFPLCTINAERKSTLSLPQVGNRLIAGLLFVGLSLVLSGCGLLPAAQRDQVAGVPTRAWVEDVPFYPQDELQCGPAALAMALDWSGLDVRPDELSPEVYSPGLEGSLQSALTAAARRHGRVAYPITGRDALLGEISAGHPVIVLVNLGFFWYPRWHYAVVIGYDQEQGEIVLHSGLNAAERLKSRVFMNIWRRSDQWGLLVLPPDRLPFERDEAAWLTAVAGLEQAGKGQAAATGYGSALQRWPQSFSAWMGLGNSRYSLSDLTGAAGAFRQATVINPASGAAFNNLAHVLAELGRRQEARTAARRAVELGGPLREMFRQTLAEIEAGSAP